MSNLAIYIHWPYCKSLCPYCDFNSYLNKEVDNTTWLNAYKKELNYFDLPDREVVSIFFGGGTPSLMPPGIVEDIISYISEKFGLVEDCEITLEANPTSVEAGKLKDFKAAGINRLSLGIQSFNSENLTFLGRKHSSDEAIEAIKTAQNNFDNVSFDLIYALPNQTSDDWKEELEFAIKFNTPHLSLYQLTIEKGTPFYAAYNKGEFILPDNELAADLYEITQEITSKYGLERYEVSNHAKEGYECKHNQLYWDYGEYLGIGPGAHGRINTEDNSKKIAYFTRHDPNIWIDSINKTGNAIQSQKIISGREMLLENILMGIRSTKGISTENINKSMIKNLSDEGYISLDDNRIYVTAKGFPVLNSVTLKLSEGLVD